MNIPVKWKGFISMFSVVLVFAMSIPAYPQEKLEEENTGQDFTRPPNRFDIHLEYLDKVGESKSTKIAIVDRVDKELSLCGE